MISDYTLQYGLGGLLYVEIGYGVRSAQGAQAPAVERKLAADVCWLKHRQLDLSPLS